MRREGALVENPADLAAASLGMPEELKTYVLAKMTEEVARKFEEQGQADQPGGGLLSEVQQLASELGANLQQRGPGRTALGR
mmetsp:Transcript_38420/g.89119  ORF Transcript_38420/g.89119 Transcript_38420/m.89119 type:complete len:82 (+) Transcript_38420:235-480(+)